MHTRRFLALVTATVVLGGCAVGISELNQRPTKYYEQAVSFRARVSRVQALPGETLLELADAQEHRIFARVEGSVDVHPDDWVKVTGILVPETRIGGKIVYDVVRADSVTATRAPWLRNLF
jgi:uncharacterized membrane protein YcgQ (UPF0703/DUF1980 family)